MSEQIEQKSLDEITKDLNTHMALRYTNPTEVEAFCYGPKDFVNEQAHAEMVRSPLKPGECIEVVKLERCWEASRYAMEVEMDFWTKVKYVLKGWF